MRQRTVQWIVLAAIVALAAGLRLYQLRDVPAGLFCDEAGLGVNAYTIATAGVDENGNRFPLFFWSFGVSLKNPIFIYAAAIPVRLLGLDEFSIRLTAALFGIGTVVAMFFLGRALFNAWVGLWAALFLAVAPWHLHFSRIAFELISFPFLFVLGMVLLVRWSQGRNTLWAAFLCFGLCLYAYQPANLFVALFLLGFGLLYCVTLVRRWRQTLLAAVVGLAIAAPAGWFHYTHQHLSTQYFRNTTNLRADETLQTQAERVGRYYLEFFSRHFLFETGDPIVRHAVRGFGELLPVFAPFLLIGALVALLRPDRPTKLLLWWLALYPLAPSLMTEIPSASRGIIGVPAFCLLAGIGLGAALWAVGWIGRWRPLSLALQGAVLAATGYFLVPQTMAYLRAYFIDYPKYSAPTYGGFQYGYRDVIQYMESQRDKYDLLLMTAVEVNQPQIFPRFYNPRDPRKPGGGYDQGYLIIDPAEYQRYTGDQRILAALRPSDLDLFNDYTVHKRIVAPGGQTEFIVAEVRSRKRFLTNWLVLGLFLNDDGNGMQQEFIDVQHLTKNRVQGPFGDVYWRPINPQFVRVDLNRFFAASDARNPGNPERVCAYAAMTLRTATDQAAFLELSGSDDYVKVWLNGQVLTGWPMMLEKKPRRRPIDLKAGNNLLLLKSCENIGSWEFAARITDADGKDLPGIEAVPEIPQGELPAAAALHEPVQLVEGFGAIVTFKDQNPTYPSYRGEGQSWMAAVHHQPSEIAWKTAPVPAKERTIFAFTASTSDEAGEMELYVNGTYALTFNSGPDQGVRVWQRGPYRMAFVARKPAAGNSGLILLEVPAAQITPGEAVELRVIPAKGKPEAWFMVKAYTDTIAHEHITPALATDTLQGVWEAQPTAEQTAVD
jgi:hypothetical protein